MKKGKFFAAIAAVMCLAIFALPILAQDEMGSGRIAGEQAARMNTNGTMWMGTACLAGFFTAGAVGLVVIVLAYVFEPNPPATQLLGKSPEYVAAYTDAYKTTAKSIQSSKSITGCIVGTLAFVLLYALAIAAEDSTTY